jgi:hypothetical protein
MWLRRIFFECTLMGCMWVGMLSDAVLRDELGEFSVAVFVRSEHVLYTGYCINYVVKFLMVRE